MKRLLFLMFWCLPLAQAAEQPMAELGGDFWFTPRHGDVIAGRDDIAAAVRRLLQEPEAYLVLRYPDTESGELWGQELQAWLVALGVVSDRIELQADAERLEAVAVVLVDPTVTEAPAAPLQIDGQVPEADTETVPDTPAEPGAQSALGAESTAESTTTATTPAAQPATEQAPEEQVETE